MDIIQVMILLLQMGFKPVNTKKNLFLLCILYSLNISINQSKVVIKGFDTAADYLQYTIWASCVLGVVSVGFMLFHQHSEPILKNATRVVAVISLLSLAYSVPKFFGINIIL